MTQLATRSQAAAGDLLGFSLSLQRRYEARTSAEERKRRGQFFTPPSVAAFMASLLARFSKHVRVLDPGAGTGTLSAAVCEHILRLRSTRCIHLTLYEDDPNAVPLLAENMAYCRAALEHAGHEMSYTIHESDFILARTPDSIAEPTLFDACAPLEPFDAVIMNPPYFKISGGSEYARVMDRIVHGQPNIHVLLMALAAKVARLGAGRSQSRREPSRTGLTSALSTAVPTACPAPTDPPV